MGGRSGSISSTVTCRLDEYADLLAGKIRAGYKPIYGAPSQEYAVSVLRRVRDVYREDGRDEDVFELEQALKALGESP
jgi:hypothetical protein